MGRIAEGRRMSRSRNTHKKGWNYPLRDAKLYSNKHRRAFKKKLITELEKVKDVNDVELPYDCKKDANKGDIRHWD